MASIAEFLIYLAENPEQLERFRENPDEVMSTWQRIVGAELTPEQKAILTSGRLVDVRKSVEAEFDVPGETVAMKIVWGIVWGITDSDGDETS